MKLGAPSRRSFDCHHHCFAFPIWCLHETGKRQKAHRSLSIFIYLTWRGETCVRLNVRGIFVTLHGMGSCCLSLNQRLTHITQAQLKLWRERRLKASQGINRNISCVSVGLLLLLIFSLLFSSEKSTHSGTFRSGAKDRSKLVPKSGRKKEAKDERRKKNVLSVGGLSECGRGLIPSHGLNFSQWPLCTPSSPRWFSYSKDGMNTETNRKESKGKKTNCELFPT